MTPVGEAAMGFALMIDREVDDGGLSMTTAQRDVETISLNVDPEMGTKRFK